MRDPRYGLAFRQRQCPQRGWVGHVHMQNIRTKTTDHSPQYGSIADSDGGKAEVQVDRCSHNEHAAVASGSQPPLSGRGMDQGGNIMA